jgi:hypothetical protein
VIPNLTSYGVTDAPTNLAAVVSTVGNIISQQIQLSRTASFSNASHPVLNSKIYLSSAFGNNVIVTPDATQLQLHPNWIGQWFIV